MLLRCLPALRVGKEDLHPVGARLSGLEDGVGVVFTGADMDTEGWHGHGAEGSGAARQAPDSGKNLE
jgi:hypothetical protein